MKKTNYELLTITLISLLLLFMAMKLDPDTLFRILKFVEKLAGTGL